MIDATTGQNGLRQARAFADAVDVTGVVLTKLDGTAKGGIALAIAGELGIPVKLIGVGEGIEDLRPFDARRSPRALVGERASDSPRSRSVRAGLQTPRAPRQRSTRSALTPRRTHAGPAALSCSRCSTSSQTACRRRSPTSAPAAS